MNFLLHIYDTEQKLGYGEITGVDIYQRLGRLAANN